MKCNSSGFYGHGSVMVLLICRDWKIQKKHPVGCDLSQIQGRLVGKQQDALPDENTASTLYGNGHR